MLLRGTGVFSGPNKKNMRERLMYWPWIRFRLPELRGDPDEWDPRRYKHQFGGEREDLTAYRVAWPGHTRTGDDEVQLAELPWEIEPERLKDGSGARESLSIELWSCQGSTGKTEAEWLGKPQLDPMKWPQWMQYHVAVNWDRYKKLLSKKVTAVPVGRIPHDVVQAVVTVPLAINAHYKATIDHLRWLAESLERDPHLQRAGFDTAIGDNLHNLTAESVRQFFYMIGDCIWDEGAKKWHRGELKYYWHMLAGYLWWTGRTGSGIVANMAGVQICPEPKPENVTEEQIWKAVLSDAGSEGRRIFKGSLRDQISNLLLEWPYVDRNDACVPNSKYSKDITIVKRSRRRFTVNNPR